MKETKLSFKRRLFFLLLMFSTALHAQNIEKLSITGTVVDSAKQPLSGVVISVNKQTLAISNSAGKFSVGVNKGS